jgi:hypothetical protein
MRAEMPVGRDIRHWRGPAAEATLLREVISAATPEPGRSGRLGQRIPASSWRVRQLASRSACVASISGVTDPSLPKWPENRPSVRANARKSIGCPSGAFAQSSRRAGLLCSEKRSASDAPRRGSYVKSGKARDSTASLAWRVAASSAMPCSGLHGV